MAQAGSARPATRASRSRLWQGPLVAGLCFGLAYGVTQRLITLNVGELIRFGQNFDVQVFPGTSLESLRLRFGEAAGEARGELELNELERQQAEEAKRQEALKSVPADPAAESGEPLGQEPASEAAPALPAEPVPAAPVAAPAAPPAPPMAPVPPPQP